ncbi:hypothetical protein ACB094_01G027000 [Castanea mollissima]
MAEIANGVAGKVLEQLGSLLLQEINSAWGVQNDLIKLESTVSAIKAVLLDAEEKQASDHRLKHWLGQLKVILNAAENVLDEFQYLILQKEVCYFFSGSNPISFHFKMAHEIKDIRKSVDDIAADKDKFNISQQLEDRETTMPMRDTHSFVNPPAVFGREDDKENIIRLFLQDDAGRNVVVIPIAGFGGLGRTTLAKLMYNDERVVGHFQLRMWVCVSEDFNATRLIKEILEFAEGHDSGKTSSEGKFLLVLDDVWIEDRDKWDKLKELLIGGFKGSKILVTTQNGSVAAIMGTAPTYNLEVLSPKDSFSLFVTLVFREGEQEWYSNLLEIGKEIVEKCKGVPLAARTLASLLYANVNQSYWEFMRGNEIWQLKQKEDAILPMAHGILQSCENQELEDVSNSYIKELWSRSFFQDVEEKIFSFYTFKMHDLALLVMQGEFSVMTKNFVIGEKVCHLSFSECDQEVRIHLKKLSKMRTIIFQIQPPMSFVEACISRFKYLRVLNLCNSTFEVLSSSIGLRNMISLTHLLVTTNHTCLLENGVGCLKSVQFLCISGCPRLKCLEGEDNQDLKLSLQKLSISFQNLEALPEWLPSLKSLQRLWIVQCPRLSSLQEGMQGLNALKELRIEGCA